MKKNDILSLFPLLLTPVLLIVLGLVLIFRPDSASALIAKLIGWFLVAVGIGFGISAVVSQRGQIGKGIAAVALVVAGGWLAKNPLLLAERIGQLAGLLLVIRGIRELLRSDRRGGKLLAIITAAVGVVLIALPMTTSRLVFSLYGVVVLLIGAAMLFDRLRNDRRLDPPDDPNIIDAL